MIKFNALEHDSLDFILDSYLGYLLCQNGNKCKYCIIIAQPIPTTTTIAANVVITIGTDTTTYPLLNCDCTNVKACQIKTRYRYSTIVHTDMQSGVFKLTGKVGCKSCCQNIDSLPIPTTTTPAQEGEDNA